jgi:prefoldin subunit 5
MMLAATAARAREDPFDKVKNMIQDLIARLQAQQDEEAEHKEWCDGELDTNRQTRDAKTKEVEALHGAIDRLQNDIAVLERGIARLSEEVAELQKAMATAEELRSKEQAENQDTIAEAVDAQSALSEAIQTLKDFYERAGAATSLAQQSHSQAPAIFNEPYKGQQTANNNVLAFLDVIQSDFARLEQETTDAENTASQEHEDYMSDSKLDRDNKRADMKKDKDTLVSKKEDLDTATTELDNAQQELDAALEYYDKLKPSCIGTQETGTSDYNTRVQRREEEIASLKEALTILSGEAVPGPGGAPAEALYSGVDGGNVGYDVGIVAGQ